MSECQSRYDVRRKIFEDETPGSDPCLHDKITAVIFGKVTTLCVLRASDYDEKDCTWQYINLEDIKSIAARNKNAEIDK